MINNHPLESIPAFVLGVLDPEESRVVAQHIAICARCSAEADSFQKSIAVDQSEPHVSLRSHVKHRLLERIAADDHRPLHRRLPPLRKPLQKPLQKPPRRRQIGVLVSSAVIVVMMLALIWFRGEPATPATALSNDQILGEREIALVQGRVPGDNRLIALLEAPQTVAHDLVPNSPASEARAALYVHIGDPRVGILIRDLPPAPVGHTYQLWVANGAGQVSLGIFTARSDGTTELIALAPAPVDAYTDFMVTVEPHGGAITPSSVIVWQVKL